MTTPPFFTGWLAQGTGSGAFFVENVASGYARQPVTLAALFNGQTQMVGGVTFGGLGSAFAVSQRGLYDAPSGGNLIHWWALHFPILVPVSGTDTIGPGMLAHRFPDLVTVSGASVVQWVAGTQVGTTDQGGPIYAGVALAYAAGVLEASSAAGLGGGGTGVSFPGGAGLSSASGSAVSVGSGLALAGGILSSVATGYSFGTGLNNSGGTVTVLYGTASGTAAQGNDGRLALASSAVQPAALPIASATQFYIGAGVAGTLAVGSVGSSLVLSGGTLSTTASTNPTIVSTGTAATMTCPTMKINTGASFTVTLPPVPVPGIDYTIKQGTTLSPVITIVPSAGTGLIENAASLTFSSANGCRTLFWEPVTPSWNMKA